MDKKGKIALVGVLILMFALTAIVVWAPPGGRGPKRCNNNIDDDNDGLIDYPADPGCANKNDNDEHSANLICDNGQDEADDADTLADFQVSGGDPGCTSATDSSEIDGECDDLADNDGDTFTDYPDDLGCTNFSDPSELGSVECDDGVDNADQDTLADYPNDLGCSSLSDNDETSQCEDSSDNDADNHIDFTSNGVGDSKCVSFTDNDESPKDFCVDSDNGKNYFVAGNVSGYDNDVSFSNFDVCIDADLLTEYFCGNKNQDYDPLNEVISCGNQSNSTGCSAGRCV